MAKKDLPFIDSLCGESRKLYDVFNEEKSDLAVVLISTSFIDACLTVSLRGHFKNCKKSDDLFDKNSGFLSSLANKTKLAYCMSIINERMYDNLEDIRKIRNEFAHTRLDICFEDEKISSMCEKLDYFQKPIRDKNGKISSTNQNPFIKITKTPRAKFVITVTIIVSELILHGMKIQNSQLKHTKDEIPESSIRAL